MKTFMEIITHTLLFMLFIIFCATPLYAQQRRGRGEGNGPPMGGRHGTDMERTSLSEYDDRPFDIAVGRLPRFYTGHNPEFLYENTRESVRSRRKDKSESAAQYPGVTRQGDARSLTETLGLDSTYAFLLKPTEAVYNAREQMLHVYCELPAISENGQEDEAKRGFRVKYEPQMDNKYTYRNASGKEITIEEVKFRDYTVTFKNFREFPVERVILPSVRRAIEKEAKKGNTGSGIDDGLKRDAIIGGFKLPKAAAEELTEMIRMLIVCNPVEPYITSDTVDIQGTTEKMRTYFAQHEYLHVRLLELWFYDFGTGKILMKISPKKPRG